MKAIIIGSGLSGLVAGTALAQAGYEVTVYEQSDQVGGVTSGFAQDGYCWDLGQLMVEGFGPDEPIGRILADLGIADQVPLVKEERGYVFPDFELRKPSQYEGPQWRIDRLISLFPDEQPGLQRYWADYLRFTRLLTFARRAEWSKRPASLYWKARLYLQLLPFLSRLKWSAQQLMDDYFKDRKLQLVFISILADFFTSPSQFPGLGVFALNPETFFDRRIPKSLGRNAEQLYGYSILGGLRTLVQALVRRIEARGGHVYTNSPVTKILVARERVIGVLLQGGERIPADILVASGGAKETFFKLVGQEHLPEDFARKVRDLPLMDSVFMVHLGINFDPTPYVHGVCTYYYGSYDLDGAIDEAHAGIYHQGERGFVVHIPSLHSPSMAPAGCHAVTIYTIAPDRLAKGTWDEHKEAYADRLVEYAQKYIPGLGEHIQSRAVLTPDDFRKRAHLEHHAFGGLAPVLGASRVPFRTPIRGLWFVGAQSESGGGVNNVIPGAYKVARSILQGKK